MDTLTKGYRRPTECTYGLCKNVVVFVWGKLPRCQVLRIKPFQQPNFLPCQRLNLWTFTFPETNMETQKGPIETTGPSKGGPC